MLDKVPGDAEPGLSHRAGVRRTDGLDQNTQKPRCRKVWGLTQSEQLEMEKAGLTTWDGTG